MPFNLGFQKEHILNPWSMQINPVNVSFYGFAILSKIPSAHCGMVFCLKKHFQIGKNIEIGSIVTNGYLSSILEIYDKKVLMFCLDPSSPPFKDLCPSSRLESDK